LPKRELKCKKTGPWVLIVIGVHRFKPDSNVSPDRRTIKAGMHMTIQKKNLNHTQTNRREINAIFTLFVHLWIKIRVDRGVSERYGFKMARLQPGEEWCIVRR